MSKFIQTCLISLSFHVGKKLLLQYELNIQNMDSPNNLISYNSLQFHLYYKMVFPLAHMRFIQG